MQEPANARRFIDALAEGLAQVETSSDESRTFVEKSVRAMRVAKLKRNPEPAAAMRRYAEWDSLLELGASQRNDDLVAALKSVDREPLPWIEGRHFWPEEEYRYFAERMFGVLMVGEEGAAFYAEDSYIVLMHVIAPHTTYPLHEHRIPEGYYIVAGHPELTRDGEHWETKPPGSLHYNRSWEPHGMRTNGEPMLSLDIYLPPFGWEGGLTVT